MTIPRVNQSAFFDRYNWLVEWGQVFDRPAYKASLLALQDVNPACMLEIGCGSGTFAGEIIKQLPDIKKYIGTEISSRSKRKADYKLRSAPHATCLLTPLNSLLPEAVDGPFDAIFSAYVLDSMNDSQIEQYLELFANLLHKDGRLIIQTVDGNGTWLQRYAMAVWTHANTLNPTITGYSRPVDIEKKLNAVGWKWKTVPIESQCIFPSKVTLAWHH